MKIEYVIKTSGETVPFELAKLEGLSRYAAKVDIEWLPLLINAMDKIEQKTVTTKDIMQAMIDACVDGGTTAHLKVAARLMRGNIYKMVYGKSTPDKFSQTYQELIRKGVWKDFGLSIFDLARLDTVFDPIMDKELEYTSLCQFTDKYGLGEGHGLKRHLYETPQLALMGIALDIFYDDSLEHVINFYNIIKKRQINIATPIMASSRTGVNGSASCFVYTSGDTLDSIAAGDHLAYMMSANRAGIGTEYDIRSFDDPVGGGKCLHAGKIPHYKALQAKIETAKQGVRAGAATVSFNIMDPEIDDLLRMKHPTTDETKRFPKMDFSLVHNMDFLRRAAKGTDWVIVSRVEAPELYRAFYYDREKFPGLMDIALESGIGKRVKARDLFKLYLRQWQETGRIYSTNVDHMNSHSPFDDVIRISNLCVAPETNILTDKGNIPIGTLEGQTVSIWNGEEYSDVLVEKTGENQELIRVTVQHYFDGKPSHTTSVRCTPYHKWYDSYSTELRTFQLEKGLHLEAWTSPEGVLRTSSIVSIDSTDSADTYCVNEPKRHRAVFNSTLTGQCQEIGLPTVPFLSVQELYDEPDPDNGLVGLCFLLAIDIAKTPKSEYGQVAYYAARALDNIIDKMHYPLENLKSGQKFRSIGVGVTNLAYHLAKEGLNYDDQYSRTEIHKMAELHQYSLYRASVDLAKERGKFEWYDRTHYGRGKLCIDTYNRNIDEFHDAELEQDWDTLYADIAEYGMRFSTVSAHMPCESSSGYGYSTNGLYPIRALNIKKSRPEGLMPFPVPGIDEIGMNYQLAWDIDQKDLYSVYGIWQKFTCQGISADSYLDKSKYPGNRVPLDVLMKNVLFAAKIGVKTNYYMNTDGKSSEIECESCDV